MRLKPRVVMMTLPVAGVLEGREAITSFALSVLIAKVSVPNVRAKVTMISAEASLVLELAADGIFRVTVESEVQTTPELAVRITRE